jgi:hypothetical protein
MRLISCHDGKLLTLNSELAASSSRQGFATGLKPLDQLLPGGLFARGAVHELLNERQDPRALTFAMLLARSGTGASPVAMAVSAPQTILSSDEEAVRSADPASCDPYRCAQHDTIASTLNPPLSTLHSPSSLVIIDPAREIYPPAIAAMGIGLEHVYFLHPLDAADQVWAIAECLRCRGVSAVIASPPPLSRIDARKLQLAAERGGGIGILLRTLGQSPHYAAATRWHVRPAPGQRTLQRWNIQLLHAPGGQVGQSVLLELSRQTLQLRAITPAAAPAIQTPALPQAS